MTGLRPRPFTDLNPVLVPETVPVLTVSDFTCSHFWFESGVGGGWGPWGNDVRTGSLVSPPSDGVEVSGTGGGVGEGEKGVTLRGRDRGLGRS